ncbi:hypothetical protein KK083_13500 [Fulvivirgaceae bacterium PWU4]|uniref:Uncharacterized protein n=1 Tax=Chryseosolibacter histidini TaxID=2782349 RepID=A0AAP2DN32_9BACT|nr:hypothetical protein [Chryseosolibacter histidini]MBT1697902.1 hypothetical protein [Chryseosolibacter histidini]
MSKKKNTLKDLDEFLKQQAATLAPPSKLSDRVQAPVQKTVQEEAPEPQEEAPIQQNGHHVSAEQLLNDLRAFAKKEGHGFRHQLYDLIIRSVESQNQFSAEDRMLINTALYLKSGDQWQDSIREYWRKKNSP